MKKILKYRKVRTSLEYRGSKHGWEAKDFYSRAKNLRATTLLLMRSKEGHCIGGFT